MQLFTSTLLALAASTSAAPAPSGEVEPNDDCGQATTVVALGTLTLTGTLTPGDVDHFEIAIPNPGFRWWYVQRDGIPVGDIELSIGPDCAAPWTSSIINAWSLDFLPSQAPYAGRAVLQVRGIDIPPQGVDYTLRIGTESCEVFLPDRFEPNDSVAAATLVPSTPTQPSSILYGLQVSPHDTDHFRLRLPPLGQGRLIATGTVPFVALAPTVLELLDPITGVWFDVGSSLTFSPAPVEQVFDVRVRAEPGFGCVGYILTWLVTLDPCGRAYFDDALEGPDTLGAAQPMPFGFYPSLTVNGLDPDAYAHTLEPGEGVFIRVTQTTPGSQNLRLQWQLGNSPVRVGLLPVVFVQNDSPVAQDLHFLVEVNSSGCAGYEFESTSAGIRAATTSVCDGYNSFGGGFPSLDVWTGSLGQGELLLHASGSPFSELIFFSFSGVAVVGTAASAPPASGAGWCIGGITTRIPVGGFAEELVFRAQLSSTPVAAYVLPGQSLYAQLWYRVFSTSQTGASEAIQFMVP